MLKVSSVSPVMIIVLSFNLISSTARAVRVPNEVIAVCAACVTDNAVPLTSPVTLPTKAVEVIEVAPVTTPASIAIVPSNNILAPSTGFNCICPSAPR